jgi:8-oxo-dGTP pyrophosphatase MutT (NUDIX family)
MRSTLASETRVRHPTWRYPGQVPPGHRLDGTLRDRIRSNLGGFERRAASGEGLRHAAVALAMLEDESGRASFVLTRRAPKLRSHGGQWALPGGRLDPGENTEQAALRELSEEVGLHLAPDSVLGHLDDYPTRSGYLITPVVVWAGEEALLEPNPHEVAAAYRVPLAELDRPDVPHLRSIPESDRPVISIPLLGAQIHAPTAAILYQLREVAVWGRDTRVHHFEQPVFAWR